MKEDSPTVMFGKKTSETKMTLWNMKEGSIGDCGNDSTFYYEKNEYFYLDSYFLRNFLINLRTF